MQGGSRSGRGERLNFTGADCQPGGAGLVVIGEMIKVADIDPPAALRAIIKPSLRKSGGGAYQEYCAGRTDSSFRPKI